MAREDASFIRLTVAFNAMATKGLVEKLPEDLRGDAIPNQVLQHEAALQGRAGTSSDESGARGEAGAIHDRTKELLKRIRHGVLSSVGDPDDPIIDTLGALGLGANQAENQVRLANLAVKLAPHVTAKKIALVDELLPEALQAHANRHAAINKAKGGATATRQTTSKSVAEEREDTREMLTRVKGFLVAEKQSLEAFGFDLPVPARRPRLARGEPPVTA